MHKIFLALALSTLCCSSLSAGSLPDFQEDSWSRAAAQSPDWMLLSQEDKSLPFTQPIPLAFGGGQYISSKHGQKIHRGHPVKQLSRGYLKKIALYGKHVFKIYSTKLYTIDYFLSVKLVIDTTALVAQIMALRVNGHEIALVPMTIVRSTVFIPSTTLVTAIYAASASTTAYLQHGDKLELVLSKKSTLPHWGTKQVHVFAAAEDLAASLFLESTDAVIS